MCCPVVLSDSVLHHIEQFLRLVDDPGVFQDLAGMEPSGGEWSCDGDDVHAGGYPRSHTVWRVLQHQTLFRWNVELLGRQQIYLWVGLGPLHVLASEDHV